MGTGNACTSCGAHIEAGQGFCTSCGATVAVAEPAVAVGAAGAASTSKGLPWLLVALVGGVATAALIGGGLFFASSGGDAGAADESLSGTSSAPVPQDTETAFVPVPQVKETVYVPVPQTSVAPQSTTPMDGYWVGSAVAAGETTFSIVLDLDQTSSGSVSGKISTTRADNGNVGSWYLSGRVDGNRVVLTPDAWINQPNSNWRKDTVTVTNSGGTLSASFVDPRDPDYVWGTATLR